jgi:predicted HTH domain antitoxin
MPKLFLEIPQEVVDAARLPPGEVESEFRKELAAGLYRRGILGVGKARLLAQMSRLQFEQLLAERQVPRHYTAADLQDDLEWARSPAPQP